MNETSKVHEILNLFYSKGERTITEICYRSERESDGASAFIDDRLGGVAAAVQREAGLSLGESGGPRMLEMMAGDVLVTLVTGEYEILDCLVLYS